MASDTGINKKGPSKAWYLLPIFFGIIGGVIMFFVIKDEDRKMAKNGVILGVILTFVGIAIAVILNIAILAAVSQTG